MFTRKTKIEVLSENSEQDELDFISSLRGANYDWQEHEAEGQLAIDVAQNDQELIIVSPMAGTPAERIGLHLHGDLLTIRGERRSPVEVGADHFYQEAYWGKFSRTIVLPTDVRYELAQAQYKNGVLVIRLPKKNLDSNIPILVIDE